MRTTNKSKAKQRLLLSLFAILFPTMMFAQKVKIQGTVTDQNNEPIIGASVVEAGTQNGVATDINGRYTLSVDKNARLRISYIGFKTKEVSARNNEA